ncbi:MAG: response regulator, partial [Butyricicoccus sp.]
MYRLLLVDDEPEILKGISQALTISSLPLTQIDTAGSAAEALTLFEKAPYDIVVSDISMPEKNGLELLAEMKAIWQSVSAVFLTGFSDFAYAQSALRL